MGFKFGRGLPGASKQHGRLVRRSLLACTALAAGYAYDRQVQASSISRTLRTFCDMAIICLDYKLNFLPERGPAHLDRIHRRAARRLLLCCKENGGLFIKFGQSIAVQSSLLPPPFREELNELYDNAPSVGVREIAPVVERSFGRPLEDVFMDFSEVAVASASVAQVHTARLRADPAAGLVAVKVQKPEIKLQIDWDLFTFRACAWLIERAFGVPIMWSVREVEQRLREELDFEREANNSELARGDLQRLADRQLRRAVYVPRVFWAATRREVLTTEWVDGTSLVDPARLQAEGWAARDVMQRMVALFAFQIFVSGNVHGDPHPGNILVRQNPHNHLWREPQLVLLDHGLYVRESPEFRRQYAQFWRAALVADRAEMTRIAAAWGMADAAMFSAMVSLRPTAQLPRDDGPAAWADGGPDGGSGGAYERQMEVKRRAIKALKETSGLPPELVFVVRNSNIVRANNQSLGIPVDRIQILGQYAALGLRRQLVDDALAPSRKYDRARGVVWERAALASRALGVLRAEWSYITFRLALCVAGVGVAVWGACGRAYALVTGKKWGRDLDVVLDDAMRRAVERKLGYRIDTSLFNA